MKTVGIIMGSNLPIVRKTAETLPAFGIPYKVRILSAHRTPAKTAKSAGFAVQNGSGVLNTNARMAAPLTDAVAVHTVLPIIGIPARSNTLSGIDALLSTVSCPPERRWQQLRSTESQCRSVL